MKLFTIKADRNKVNIADFTSAGFVRDEGRGIHLWAKNGFKARMLAAETWAGEKMNEILNGLTAKPFVGDCRKPPAIEHIETLDSLIDGEAEDDLGQVLTPIRDYLVRVANE